MVLNILSFAFGLVAMEGLAWAMHRYVMHGPLWAWHKSHHEPRAGAFELNDLFGFVFAAIAVGLFWAGGLPGLQPLWWLAAGVTAYGVLYALVHDGLVHRRFRLPLKADRGYLLRLARAHHLHHMTNSRDGAVSFGFLLAPDPERLAEQLKLRREAA